MLRILILTLFVCLAVASAVPQAAAAARRGKRIGFILEDQFRKEENDGSGGVVGEYGMRTGDGCLRVIRYKVTKRGGFRIQSTEKRDCDPSRVVSRVRPVPPRAKLVQAARTTQQVPQQTFAPIVEPLTTTKPAVKTTTKPKDIPLLVTTGRPLPNAIALPKVTKKPKQRKAPKLRRNRPKQLKKEFDFKALSAGNPARPLDKKDDPVYSFGFTAPGHGHTQAGLPDGSKKGEYYFDSPDGWRRIVTYVANKKGFFPKMRRVRIPGWTSTTPAPRVTRKKNKPNGETNDDIEQPGKSVGLEGPNPDNLVEQGGDPGSGGNKNDDSKLKKKQIIDSLRNRGVGSCPYYFFYNTKVNFHWERCMENGTKVGQYGRLHEDGFSYRTSYYADRTGYHPTSTKVPLSDLQQNIVHDFTQGVFILPKTDEERQKTEQRILDWLDQNKDLLRDPLQPR